MRQRVFRCDRRLQRRQAAGLPPPRTAIAKQRADDLVTSFRSHLLDVCGMASVTCNDYCHVARSFLQTKYSGKSCDLTLLSSGDVVGYVSGYAARVSAGSAKRIVTGLRAFLKWLLFRGLCDAQIAGAVPGVPYRTLVTIPKLLTDDQVCRLLKAFDRSTVVGRRDYAIALCMVRLGLRSGEVARLRLDDIDWRVGTVDIDGGKRRRPHVLPVPYDLSRAIAAYLKRNRPRSTDREVFLRHTSPHRPMCSKDIGRVIRRAHERGRVGSPWKGTHALRHTLASRLLRGGASLKQIADILGHRSIDTTAIYTKVDIERLAGVALPWPVGRP